MQASLCLLDVDENRIELPEEIPDLPGRDELIKEISSVMSKFGVKPPKGCILLRPVNASREKDDGLDSNSSFENIDTDMGGYYDGRERVPPKKAASFKGQYRLRGRPSVSERPVVRRHRSHSSSPSMRRTKTRSCRGVNDMEMFLLKISGNGWHA